MRVVVDTNVVAYFLLGTEPFTNEARQFWLAVKDPIAPALWEAELANVVWMAVRTGVLAAAEGSKRLDLAARLGIRSIPSQTLWQGALARALQSSVAVYDTLFVELASREHIPLATFDAKLAGAFPEIAKRPRTILDATV